MVVICTRKSVILKKINKNLMKRKFGISLCKQYVVWMNYIKEIFFIEISNQQIFFLLRKGKLRLVIWMFLKLQKMVFYILRLVHLIMLHLKYGRINHMIQNRMFGQLVVYYMRWQHKNHHFELKTWKVCIKKLLKLTTVVKTKWKRRPIKLGLH